MTQLENRAEWTNLVEQCLESFRRYDTPEELRNLEDESEPVSFVRAFLMAAVQRAQAAGYSARDPETADLVDDAFKISSGIAFPYTPLRTPQTEDEYCKATRMRLTRFGSIDFEELRQHRPNSPMLEELEPAVMAYLASQWRMPWADRLLLKLLLEQECGQYLHQMLSSDILDPKGRSELQKAQQAARRTGLGQSLKVAFYSVLALVAVVAAAFFFSDAASLILLVGGVFVLFLSVVFLAITVWFFVRFGPERKGRANKTKELVRLATEKVLLFKGDTPVSVSDFRRHVEELRDAGFTLPQTLFGLLDTLEAEGKVIV